MYPIWYWPSKCILCCYMFDIHILIWSWLFTFCVYKHEYGKDGSDVGWPFVPVMPSTTSSVKQLTSASLSSWSSRRTGHVSAGTKSVSSISKFEDLFGISPTPLQTSSRRNTIPLSRSVRHRSERTIDPKGRGHPKACLLRQRGSNRRQDKVHKDWKASDSSLHCCEKAEALLSIFSHRRPDWVSTKSYCEKSRGQR